MDPIDAIVYGSLVLTFVFCLGGWTGSYFERRKGGTDDAANR